MQVRDRGKGISPARLAEIQTKGSGVGIRGMRERLRQFHGEMTIESSSSGTTILGTMPLFEEPPAIAQRVNLTEHRATTCSGAKARGRQEIIRSHYQSPFRIEYRGRGKVETGIGNGRSWQTCSCRAEPEDVLPKESTGGTRRAASHWNQWPLKRPARQRVSIS